MQDATGVLGGLSLWGIIVPIVVVAVIVGGIALGILAARKGVKGMDRLDKRVDHSEKKDEKKKGKGPTRARRY